MRILETRPFTLGTYFPFWILIGSLFFYFSGSLFSVLECPNGEKDKANAKSLFSLLIWVPILFAEGPYLGPILLFKTLFGQYFII